jgi:hypothetical protein
MIPARQLHTPYPTAFDLQTPKAHDGAQKR